MAEVKRRSKDISGYLILNILAEIDGQFPESEKQVISEYVSETFPSGGNLEEADAELQSHAKEDYPILFRSCAEDFFANSNEHERLHFIDFAMKLINADKMVDEDENWMLNKLYLYWDL